MQGIFISYRREDSEGHAGRLFEDLVEHFGRDAVFMDVADIQPGRDFRKVIDAQVASCGVLLAIIGKRWLDAHDEGGQRRLDDPADFVRLETASALKRDIPVVPVLVQGARMPTAAEIPDDLKDLAFRNAVELTHARWESDVQVLIDALRKLLSLPETSQEAPGATRKGADGASPPAVAMVSVKPASGANSRRALAVGAGAVVAVAVGAFLYVKHPAEPAAPQQAQQRTRSAKAAPAADPSPPQEQATQEPASAAGASLVGRYLVRGTNPDGSTYAGRAAIQAMGNGHFEVTWTIGGQRYKGLGVFDPQTRKLDVASDSGPVSYQLLEDGGLLGRWAKGHATETLSRQPPGDAKE